MASLCCALSDWLLPFSARPLCPGVRRRRHCQCNTALIRHHFPLPDPGRGMGINAMVVAVSAAIGPTVAAGILSVARWPWLFAVNVPLGSSAWESHCALCPGRRFGPRLRPQERGAQRDHVRPSDQRRGWLGARSSDVDGGSRDNGCHLRRYRLCPPPNCLTRNLAVDLLRVPTFAL